MFRRLFNACLRPPGDLRHSRDDFEIIGTFNSGAVEFGFEDPRITRIGDTCWFNYVALSRHACATDLASTWTWTMTWTCAISRSL